MPSKEVAVNDTQYPNLPAVQDKPLTSSQIKVLERIVKSDFADLTDRLMADVGRREREAKEVLSDKYGDKNLDKWTAKATALHQRYMEQARKLVEQARLAGVDATTPHRINDAAVQMSGWLSYQQELNRLVTDYRVLREGIQKALDAETRQIERLILLQGVTSLAAFDLVDNTPTIESIMESVKVRLAESYSDVVERLFND